MAAGWGWIETHPFQPLQAHRERLPGRLLAEGLDLNLLLWWYLHEVKQVVVLLHRVLAWKGRGSSYRGMGTELFTHLAPT